MARIPPLDPSAASAPVQALFARLRRDLYIEPNNFFKTMGHAPDLLAPLIAFSRVLLEEGVLDRRLKEWVILQIGRLNACDYVFEAHKQALSRAILADVIGDRGTPPDPAVLDEAELLAIRYAGLISANAVDDATFAEVQDAFTDRELVELTTLAAYYTFICRIVNALGVEPDELTFLASQPAG